MDVNPESEPVQTYVYQPLSGSRVIRVAEIQPGEYGSPLTITLRETVLPLTGNGQAKPEYQTLSYEWGQNKRDTPIDCDGYTVLITKNLEAALRRIRLIDRPLRMWIDSLCINQENIEERNHQVTLMPLIYKCSPRVNMWLGEENTNTEEGIRMLGKLNDLYEQLKKALKNSSKDWLLDEIASINALKIIIGDGIAIYEEKQEQWVGLKDIMNRTYFERAWIVQEILLSWNATVVIGRHRFSWNLLQKAKLIMNKCTCLQADSSSLASFRLGIIALYDKLHWKGQKYTILSLLQSLSISRCYDPRDIIYSLCGIAQYPHGAISDNQAVDIGLLPPDYSKSVEQVYQETCTALIMQSQNLKIFFNIQVPRLRNLPSMPTWVVDWSPSPEGWLNEYYSNNRETATVNSRDVSGFTRNLQWQPVKHALEPLFPTTATLTISISGNVLTTQGLSLGNVTWTSHAIYSQGIVHSIAKLHSAINDRYNNTLFEKYINGEPILQALCRTLLMNENDHAAEARGFGTTGPGGWTPMFESFFGVLALDQILNRANEVAHIPLELFRSMCLEKTGAGLFLSAVRHVNNERVFQTDGAGTLGIAALDIQVDDRVVLLRGAYAPVVLRRVESKTAEYEGGRWEIVCEAYVHAAMDKGERIYSEGLCKDWEEYMIY